MGTLFTSILLVIIRLGSSAPQNVEDIILLNIEAVAEGQNRIVQKLEDLQSQMTGMEGSLETVKENVSNLHSQMTGIEVQVENVQKCSTRDQVEAFKNMFITGQVEHVQKCSTRDQVEAFRNTFITELETVTRPFPHCPTRDQIITFQDLLETDECEEGSHNCSSSANCKDFLFHYQCYCLPGYSGDGFTCEDVDECREIINACGDEQICINRPGNYSCTCHEGYKKEGNTCQGSDCESPSQVILGLGCVTPLKEEMSWEQGKGHCRRRGERLLEGIKPEHLQQLKQHFLGYVDDEYALIGVRGGVWVTTRDLVSSQDGLWHSTEPNGSDQKKDDCGQIRLSNSPPYLMDYHCSDKVLVLCQRL